MIESELDLHLYYIYSKKKRFWFLHFTPSHLNNKENHNVNNNYENMCSSEKKEEKKKKKTRNKNMGCSKRGLGLAWSHSYLVWGLGRAATWVWRSLGWLELASPFLLLLLLLLLSHSLSLSLSLFIFSFLSVFLLCLHFGSFEYECL